MLAIAKRWLLLSLVGGIGAGCAPSLPPQPAMMSPAAAPTSPTPKATSAARAAEEQRARYIARAISGLHLPGLEGLRRTGNATGFYIAADKIITNYHVAGYCKALTVGNDVEGNEMLAKVVASDATADLAVLATEPTVAEPARFETTTFTETGKGLAIVGYPEHGLSVLEAELSPVVAEPRDLISNRPRFMFSGVIRRGNSGSPVLDNTGAVVGIVASKVDTIAVYQKTGYVIDNVGFAISNRGVVEFLRSNGIGYLTAAPAPGLTPTQLLDRAHSFVRQIGCWK